MTGLIINTEAVRAAAAAIGIHTDWELNALLLAPIAGPVTLTLIAAVTTRLPIDIGEAFILDYAGEPVPWWANEPPDPPTELEHDRQRASVHAGSAQ